MAASVGPVSAEGAEAEARRILAAALDGGGWLWHRCADSRRCRGAAGLPDFVAVHPAGGPALAVEVKGPRTRVSPAQRRWLDALGAAGIDARLVRGRAEAAELARSLSAGPLG